ncbi:unnamed protein product [Haemonchus placei]|uniref:Recep_L_domain domain-containing protein n=1 Tax=Haemonchus placei TaxID=6290 RepID=A0A0N4WTM8_HAEPC|nr:unnamed protein product [Haemonchus placei]
MKPKPSEMESINLCFSSNEMKSFIYSYKSTEIGLNRSCRIRDNSTLATIPANCETLIGRLTIDHTTDLSHLWKLYNVTTIYGQLVIRNTSITCLAALWKLENVVNLTGSWLAWVSMTGVGSANCSWVIAHRLPKHLHYLRPLIGHFSLFNFLLAHSMVQHQGEEPSQM